MEPAKPAPAVTSSPLRTKSLALEDRFPRFDMSLVLRQVGLQYWEPEKGPFRIKSLSEEEQAHLAKKKETYLNCFVKCYRLRRNKAQQLKEKAENTQNKFSLTENLQALTASGDLVSLEGYFQFRTELKIEKYWVIKESEIELNTQLSPQDKIDRKEKLAQFRKEFCSEDAVHLAHYSPQALICACETLASLETITSRAMHALSKKGGNSGGSSENLDWSLSWPQIKETDDQKIEFSKQYEGHLQRFSAAIEKEKQRILTALEIRFRIVQETGDLFNGDVIQFIATRFNALGLTYSATRFIPFKQGDAEWNGFCKWYLEFKGTLPLEQFMFCKSSAHPNFAIPFRIFPHSQGWITCLDNAGGAPKECSYQGPSPATLTRYHLLLRNLPNACEAATCRAWTPLLALVAEEIQQFPSDDAHLGGNLLGELYQLLKTDTPANIFAKLKEKLSSSMADTSSFMLRWKCFWLVRALELLANFKPDNFVDDLERLSEEEFLLFCHLGHLVKLLTVCTVTGPAKDHMQVWSKRYETIYEKLVNAFIIKLTEAGESLDHSPLQSPHLIRFCENLVDQILKFSSADRKDGWTLVQRVLRKTSPSSSSEALLNFFKSLNRSETHTWNALQNFLKIFSQRVHSYKDEYLTFVKVLDAIIQVEVMKGSYNGKFESIYDSLTQKITSRVNQSITHLLADLNNGLRSFGNAGELRDLFDALEHLPKEREKLRQGALECAKGYRPDKQQALYLAEIMVKLNDRECVETFLDPFLRGLPSLEALDACFTVLEPAFKQFPTCRQKVKRWLLTHLNPLALFPRGLTQEKIVSVIAKCCPEDKEEVLYALDSCYLKRLEQYVQPSAGKTVSVSEVRAFLNEVNNYRFPSSEQGLKEYRTLIASFSPTIWNPVVWEVLRAWGPANITQKWRHAWLKSCFSNNPPVTSPQEILAWEGPHQGYYRLLELFGKEYLSPSLKILNEWCEQKRPLTPSLQRFWEELGLLIGVPSKAAIELDIRDQLLPRSYDQLMGHYRRLVSPMLNQGKEILPLVRVHNWQGCFALFKESIRANLEAPLRGLVLHLEEGLSKQLIDTEALQRPGLVSAVQEFKSQFLEPLKEIPATSEARAILTPFLQRMGVLCNNVQPLHKFLSAFAAITPNEDWILSFEEESWTEYFPLLNGSMRTACALLLNRYLPLCINPASYFAWMDAIDLLHGRHSNPQKGLENIEKAILNVRQEAVKVSLEIQGKQQWRKERLSSLLPTSSAPLCFSMTRGRCDLHSVFRSLLTQEGECTLPQDPEYSHPVAYLGNFKAFLKWKPHAFGPQLMNHYLFQYAVGGHTPFLDFVKFKGKPGFFQLSEAIPGRSLDDLLQSPVPPKIDPKSFSQNFVRMLLDCEWDGKSKNYQATPTSHNTWLLTMVDGELSSNRPYRFHDKGDKIEIEILLSSILPCLDQVHDYIHPEVAKWLKYLDISKALKQVLIACKQARRRLISCIEESEEIQAWEQADPRYLGLQMQKRYLEHWFTVLSTLKNLLNSKNSYTHMELLQALFPPVAHRHLRVHKDISDPEERFLNLNAEKYKVLVRVKEGRPRKTLLTSHSRQVLLTCLSSDHSSDEPSSSYRFETALTDLDTMDRQSQQIVTIRAELQKGNVAPFQAITLQMTREAVLWGSNPTQSIQWKELSTEIQKRILEAMQGHAFTRLHLAYCSELTLELLISFISSSPGLEVLDLSGCPFLEGFSFAMLSSRCRELRELNVTETSFPDLRGSFPHLIVLKADRSKLASVTPLHAPQLRSLSIERCYYLRELHVEAHPLCRLAATGCSVEAANSLRLVQNELTPTNNLREIRFSFTLATRGTDDETVFNACVMMDLIGQVEATLQGEFEWTYGKQGRNPLHVAVATDKLLMIDLLSTQSAFVYALDEQRRTPSMAAAAEGNQPAIQLLLQRTTQSVPLTLSEICVDKALGILNVVSSYLGVSRRNHLAHIFRVAYDNKQVLLLGHLCKFIQENKDKLELAPDQIMPDLSVQEVEIDGLSCLLPDLLKAGILSNERRCLPVLKWPKLWKSIDSRTFPLPGQLAFVLASVALTFPQTRASAPLIIAIRSAYLNLSMIQYRNQKMKEHLAYNFFHAYDHKEVEVVRRICDFIKSNKDRLILPLEDIRKKLTIAKVHRDGLSCLLPDIIGAGLLPEQESLLLILLLAHWRK